MYLTVEKDNALARLHPNTKTVSLLILFFASLLVDHPLYALIPFAAALAVLVVGGGVKRAVAIAPGMAMLFVVCVYIWTFMYVDPMADYTWWSVGGWAFPRETFLLGIGMGTRIMSMLMLGLAFLTVTRVEDFTNGLNAMRVPYGLCFSLSLSFRLLPLFIGSATTIRDAQRARGLDLDTGGYIEKARKYVPLLIPVFVSSMRNSDGLALALMSKGFGRSNERTSLTKLKFGFGDAVAIIAVATLTALLWWMRRLGLTAV